MLVKERKKKPFSREFEFKPLLRFNENGEYVTEDEKLIERMKRRFEYKDVTGEPSFIDIPPRSGGYLLELEYTAPLEIECKYCGGTHRNRQGVAACARKHKKEVV